MDLYEALAAGISFADIALSTQKAIDSVTSLQVSQLQQQLDQNMVDNISPLKLISCNQKACRDDKRQALSRSTIYYR